MITFKEIKITGLFGESDVQIPIKDNRIILVGYNGIGKSTILNIFYYFISQQWHKLREQDFVSVSLRVQNKNRKLTIDRTELLGLEPQRRDRRNLKYSYRDNPGLFNEAHELLSHRARNTEMRSGAPVPRSTLQHDIVYLRKELGVPMRVAEELIREFLYMTHGKFEFDSKAQKKVANVEKFLSEHLEGRILYLPTYRRIEKDIKTAFPEIEDELVLQRKHARHRHELFKNENYIELVQFGMEDVKENLANRLESVKAYALSQINSLTTKYLRDVIRDEAKQYGKIATSHIREGALDSVFSKVDSQILTDEDKKKITEVVNKIMGGHELLENEKYVAHYVLYLVEVGNNISKLEMPIQQFAEICNSYLYGKSFIFDNVSYKVSVIHESGRPVEMEELSSGEKQIVSLFSHLLLDQDVSNYIVIDEPELSLSVDWQQRFLKDISDLSTCAFIGAVTHSPFIFENSLDGHTIDLLEHTKPSL